MRQRGPEPAYLLWKRTTETVSVKADVDLLLSGIVVVLKVLN